MDDHNDGGGDHDGDHDGIEDDGNDEGGGLIPRVQGREGQEARRSWCAAGRKAPPPSSKESSSSRPIIFNLHPHQLHQKDSTSVAILTGLQQPRMEHCTDS